jgi:hypothetical protein
MQIKPASLDDALASCHEKYSRGIVVSANAPARRPQNGEERARR